eukprot:scaffold132034_cov42-Cyclotella_meneghiniana.AAC.1
MEVTVGETAYEWIRQFEETKDGRGAMAALLCTAMEKTLPNSESQKLTASFEKQRTLMSSISLSRTMQRYFKRPTLRTNSLIRFALTGLREYVSNNLADDWIQAVNYIKTKVAQAFPGANHPNNRNDRRFVSKANAGRGKGRGRGGWFGRGGGRFGHGGRGS